MLIKPFDFRFKVSNSQPCIAAHLQGTQSHATKANLAKELQSPTHGKQFSIQRIITKLYNFIEYSISLRNNKRKRKNKGLRPQSFPFFDLLFIINNKIWHYHFVVFFKLIIYSNLRKQHEKFNQYI